MYKFRSWVDGDFQNATVTWNADIEDNDGFVFMIEQPDGIYMRTSYTNGTEPLHRTYFLRYSYVYNTGGTNYRGIHLYCRSDNGTAFNITITIEGYVWKHYVDFVQQRDDKTIIIGYSILLWEVSFMGILIIIYENNILAPSKHEKGFDLDVEILTAAELLNIIYSNNIYEEDETPVAFLIFSIENGDIYYLDLKKE